MPYFAEYLLSQSAWGQWLDFAVRLIAACLCGACIGYERSKHLKVAGIRTHIIVCCTAALIMVVSKYGFMDLTLPGGSFLSGTRGADPARLAAQIVSGISFLCAGVIFKNGNTIKGLTTAAGIWATAAIGMAIGAGMYLMGLFATVIMTVIQFILHKHSPGSRAYITNLLTFIVREDVNFYALLQSLLEDWDASITESRVSRLSAGKMEYRLTVRSRNEIPFTALDAFLRDHDGILSGNNQIVG